MKEPAKLRWLAKEFSNAHLGITEPFTDVAADYMKKSLESLADVLEYVERPGATIDGLRIILSRPRA